MSRTSGRRFPWPTFLIPLVLMAWARYGAVDLAMASFDSATLYAGPYRSALPPGPSGAPIADQVVLVVVDGLRQDTSQSMEFLNEMRSRGSDRTVVVGQPSLSYPGWTVIGTGAWQEASGFASNYVDRPIEVDSLLAAVGRTGGTSAIVGSEGWDQLYRDQAGLVRIVAAPETYDSRETVLDHDRRVSEEALRLLAEAPTVLLVHFPSVDTAGHGWGGASAEYAAAAAQVDDLIRSLAGNLDLTRVALFVTSDHGHTDPGGHAGSEPEVLNVPLVGIGAGIKPGEYPSATQADIAPTLALLLGAPIPSHNQGRPLLDQIRGSEALLAARTVDVADQVTARYQNMIEIADPGTEGPDTALLEEARTALAEGRIGESLLLALQAIDRAEARWGEVRADRLDRERAGRAAVALALLLPAALYGWWWRRRGWNGWAPALGAALYLLVWNANYHGLQRLTYSASWFNNDSDIEPFLMARVIEALIASAAAVLLVAFLRRRQNSGEIARDSAHTLLLIGLAQMVQILIFYVAWGATYTWHLPDFSWGFKYYLDVIQTTASWPMTEAPAAAILVGLAPVVAWLIRTIEAGFRRTAGPPA